MDSGEASVKVPVGENVSSGSLPRVTQMKFPDGTPWWARLLLQTVSMVGIPAAICGFLLWERATVMKEFSATNQTMKNVVERAIPVLERLERKIP